MNSILPQASLYIHWPFCLKKCPYCDFNSHVRAEIDEAAWRDALLTELRTHASELEPTRLTSIFFGGGTPSLMPPATVAALIEEAARLFTLPPDMEITLEANPTSVEAGKFRAFRASGVNRVSIGVQSFDAQELHFLGREHSPGDAMRAIALANEHFPRTSFDLIYARPNQTLEGWEAELTQALTLARGHLSLYQLTIEENTAFHTAYKKSAFSLPDEEQSAALYELTETLMQAEGYEAYEVSNYARPGQESAHNLNYWRYGDYIGIGPGAHGRITLNGQKTATQTLKSPERWLEQVGRTGHGRELGYALSAEEVMEERLMMGLRLHEGLDISEIPLNPRALQRAEMAGLVTLTGKRLCTTPRGRLILNHLTGELLAG